MPVSNTKLCALVYTASLFYLFFHFNSVLSALQKALTKILYIFLPKYYTTLASGVRYFVEIVLAGDSA